MELVQQTQGPLVLDGSLRRCALGRHSEAALSGELVHEWRWWRIYQVAITALKTAAQQDEKKTQWPSLTEVCALARERGISYEDAAEEWLKMKEALDDCQDLQDEGIAI